MPDYVEINYGPVNRLEPVPIDQTAEEYLSSRLAALKAQYPAVTVTSATALSRREKAQEIAAGIKQSSLETTDTGRALYAILVALGIQE